MEIFAFGIVLGVGIGLASGVYFGSRLADSRNREKIVTEQARREASEAALDREKQIFESQLAEMKTTFQGLASESLEASRGSFACAEEISRAPAVWILRQPTPRAQNSGEPPPSLSRGWPLPSCMVRWEQLPAG